MNIIDSGAVARVASARGQMRGGACYWGVDLLGGWKTPQEEGEVGGGPSPGNVEKLYPQNVFYIKLWLVKFY